MRARCPHFACVSLSVLCTMALLPFAALHAQQPPAATPQQSAPDQPKLPPQQPVMPPDPGAAGPGSAPAQIPMFQNSSAAPFTLSASETGTDAPSITEDELRQQLEGKTFYLRGGYLDNSLHFDEHGAFDGSSMQASYTLSLVQIDHVHLDKKKVEFEGVRFGLHFLGASTIEDQAVDKVRLTTKKKPLRIVIAREQLVKAKEEKEPRHKGPVATPASGQPNLQTRPPGTAPVQPPQEEERRGGVVTTSQAHANQALQKAIDRVFSAGIDDKMISTLPDYWKLFYKSLNEHQVFRPADSSVLRQSQVDQKAKLTAVIEPSSNEYAQKNGVAGMAMFHVVVGPDGKAKEIAVGRPIGFGLDENAVNAIRQAIFQPAMKDGKPVPVLLDLVVQFRIFSKRTAVASTQPVKVPGQSEAPILPGPYTANAKRPPAQPQPEQPQPDQQQQSGQPPAPQPAGADQTTAPPQSAPSQPPENQQTTPQQPQSPPQPQTQPQPQPPSAPGQPQ